MSITIDELKTLMADLGGLFGFTEEVDAGTLMTLLDSDGNSEISWQVMRGWTRSRREAAPRRRSKHTGDRRMRSSAHRVAHAACGPACTGVVACVRGLARGHAGAISIRGASQGEASARSSRRGVLAACCRVPCCPVRESARVASRAVAVGGHAVGALVRGP